MVSISSDVSNFNGCSESKVLDSSIGSVKMGLVSGIGFILSFHVSRLVSVTPCTGDCGGNVGRLVGTVVTMFTREDG